MSTVSIERDRPIAVRKLTRAGIAIVCTLAGGLALGSIPASASEHHPTGGYAPFADCPLGNTSLESCIYGSVGSGEFVVGRRVVPIDSTLTVQGGVGVEALTFFGAEDGNTLSKALLSVPGGLDGNLAPEYLPASSRERLDESTGAGLTAVTMTPELALPASTIKLNTENLVNDEGVVLQLPLKIKLNNPFLGEDCYIGSATDPIIVKFTVAATSPPAPNKPIKGVKGHLEFLEEFDLVIDHGVTLVDNAFAVPRATGCGGSLSALVDLVVDAELGLPSPAGHNTAMLNATLELGEAPSVRASE